MSNLIKKIKDKYGLHWLFLGIILILYFSIGIFNYDLFINIGKDFIKIFINQILLVLFIVFIFMFFLNILLEKETIKNKIKSSKNSTKYIISLIGGIFSTGPVYMWYPFLKKLNNNGLNYGHISTFIYARAIKIPFLAVMTLYFGLKYTIIFNITLVFISIIVGVIINYIFNFKYNNKV